MATNLIMKDGQYQSLTVPSGITSGDPVELGQGITGVALTDRDATSGKSAVDLGPAVYDLPVQAVDDEGDVLVADMDRLYINMEDTVKISKKSSGTFFGYAREAVALGATATINVWICNAVGAGMGAVVVGERFQSAPVCVAKDGAGAATGTTGDENVMQIGKNMFEYHILGTQTILSPVFAAAGLDVGMDQTDNDGVEVGQGITARSPVAFTVGSGAFFGRLTFTIATVAGTDDCAFGFRKAEAYQANIDDYDEMAALNVIAGDIKIETILNAAATTVTDTTDNWADAAEHTLEVYVSDAGVVTYKIDGAAPTVVAAFTFDAAEVLVPFFYQLQANAAQTAIVLKQWEVGYS